MIRRYAIVLAALAVSALRASAATAVTVRLTDREGHALSDVRVDLTLLESETPQPPWGRYIPTRATGVDGRATFPGLEPGVYATSIAGLSDDYLISPARPGTDATQGRFTVRDEASLTVPIVLARGDQVNVEFKSDIPTEPNYQFSFVEVVTGARVSRTLVKETKARVLLPVGRWRVEFSPPPGLVFRELDIDGATAPLATGTLEIVDGGRERFVTFVFTGPCLIHAHVTVNGDPPGILATQTAPGPLTDAATAVGAPPVTPVWIPQDFRAPTFYHGWLPDGVWRIAPTSEGLESSDPPFVDVDCTTTPQHALEFSVRMRDGGGASRDDRLTVTVTDPDGDELDDAVVEVYLAEAFESGAPPLARKRTSAPYRFAARTAVFKGLPRKPLLVVAGHAEWIDAAVDVPVKDPKEKDPGARTAEVRLGAGATIDVDAIKPDQTPARGVSLRLDRQDPSGAERAPKPRTPAARRVQDEALRDMKRHLAVRTDATGRARMRGIEPGRYVADGEYAESEGGRYFVQVKEGAHDPADALPLQFEGTERIHLTLLLRTAASVVASLVCDDRGALPLKVDARLFPADRDAAWRKTLPVGDINDALFKLDGQPLGGPRSSQLHLGPLKPGVYGLAIRARGFDRWSFAGGGDDPSRSMTLQLQDAQELDLGEWTIPCRPSLLLVAQPIGDAKALPAGDPKREPDVSHAAVTSRIAASTVRVDRETAARRSYRALETQPLLHAMRLYGVPNEPVTVALQVRDRFLLPEMVSPRPDPLTLDLERGREQIVPLQFEALAGSIDIALDAPGARAIFADGTMTPIPRAAGSMLLRAGPLRPGVYAVEVCSDPACSRIERRFEGVSVTALAVTTLPPP